MNFLSHFGVFFFCLERDAALRAIRRSGILLSFVRDVRELEWVI